MMLVQDRLGILFFRLRCFFGVLNLNWIQVVFSCFRLGIKKWVRGMGLLSFRVKIKFCFGSLGVIFVLLGGFVGLIYFLMGKYLLVNLVRVGMSVVKWKFFFMFVWRKGFWKWIIFCFCVMFVVVSLSCLVVQFCCLLFRCKFLMLVVFFRLCSWFFVNLVFMLVVMCSVVGQRLSFCKFSVFRLVLKWKVGRLLVRFVSFLKWNFKLGLLIFSCFLNFWVLIWLLRFSFWQV